MADVLSRLLNATFSPRGLRIAVPFALACVVAAGAAFAALEDRSLGDGLWWAIVTVTTVGYGDVTPITTAGKALAVTLMLGGIGFLLILAGALVEHFIAVEVEEREVLRQLEALSRQVDELAQRVDERLGPDLLLADAGCLLVAATPATSQTTRNMGHAVCADCVTNRAGETASRPGHG